MMRIVWTDEARNELASQIRYVAVRDRDAARRQRSRIHQAVSALRETPRIGRPGRVADTRELVIDRTPYLAIYEIIDTTVYILHVFHGRQNWQSEG